MDLKKLNQKYGGVIKFPGESGHLDGIEYISTGSMAIDLSLGERGKMCGIPRGLLTTVWGKEGGGKTTFMAMCMREAQKLGQVAFGNLEHRCDPDYFGNIGVDMDDLTVFDIDPSLDVYGEQVGDIVIALTESGEYSMIAVDSVAAWAPKIFLVGETSENAPGKHALMMKKILVPLVSAAKRTGTAILFTSQRSALFGRQSFAGPSYGLVGGNALKFYSSVLGRIDYTGRVRESSSDDTVVGITSRITWQKNVGPAFQWAEFQITDGLGIDIVQEVFDLGKDLGVAYRKGAWYYYIDEETGEEATLGHGRRDAFDNLRSQPDLLASLIRRIRENYVEEP
jgi:recombination protein RecA